MSNVLKSITNSLKKPKNSFIGFFIILMILFLLNLNRKNKKNIDQGQEQGVLIETFVADSCETCTTQSNCQASYQDKDCIVSIDGRGFKACNLPDNGYYIGSGIEKYIVKECIDQRGCDTSSATSPCVSAWYEEGINSNFKWKKCDIVSDGYHIINNGTVQPNTVIISSDDKCPDGFNHITDDFKCIEASELLRNKLPGITYKGISDADVGQVSPYGCWHYANVDRLPNVKGVAGQEESDLFPFHNTVRLNRSGDLGTARDVDTSSKRAICIKANETEECPVLPEIYELNKVPFCLVESGSAPDAPSNTCTGLYVDDCDIQRPVLGEGNCSQRYTRVSQGGKETYIQCEVTNDDGVSKCGTIKKYCIPYYQDIRNPYGSSDIKYIHDMNYATIAIDQKQNPPVDRDQTASDIGGGWGNVKMVHTDILQENKGSNWDESIPATSRWCAARGGSASSVDDDCGDFSDDGLNTGRSGNLLSYGDGKCNSPDGVLENDCSLSRYGNTKLECADTVTDSSNYSIYGASGQDAPHNAGGLNTYRDEMSAPWNISGNGGGFNNEHNVCYYPCPGPRPGEQSINNDIGYYWLPAPSDLNDGDPPPLGCVCRPGRIMKVHETLRSDGVSDGTKRWKCVQEDNVSHDFPDDAKANVAVLNSEAEASFNRPSEIKIQNSSTLKTYRECMDQTTGEALPDAMQDGCSIHKDGKDQRPLECSYDNPTKLACQEKEEIPTKYLGGTFEYDVRDCTSQAFCSTTNQEACISRALNTGYHSKLECLETSYERRYVDTNGVVKECVNQPNCKVVGSRCVDSEALFSSAGTCSAALHTTQMDCEGAGESWTPDPTVSSAQWAQCDEAADEWYVDSATQEVKKCTPPVNAPLGAIYTCTNAQNTQLLSDCGIHRFKSEGDSLCTNNQKIHKFIKGVDTVGTQPLRDITSSDNQVGFDKIYVGTGDKKREWVDTTDWFDRSLLSAGEVGHENKCDCPPNFYLEVDPNTPALARCRKCYGLSRYNNIPYWPYLGQDFECNEEDQYRRRALCDIAPINPIHDFKEGPNNDPGQSDQTKYDRMFDGPHTFNCEMDGGCMHAGDKASVHHQDTVYTKCLDTDHVDGCNTERRLWDEWAYACPEVHREFAYDDYGLDINAETVMQETQTHNMGKARDAIVDGVTNTPLCRINPDEPLDTAAAQDNKLCITSIKSEISTIMSRGPRRFINGILNRDKDTVNDMTADGVGANPSLDGRGGFPNEVLNGEAEGMPDTNYDTLYKEYTDAIQAATDEYYEQAGDVARAEQAAEEARLAQAAADAQVALDRARDVGAAPGGSTPVAQQVIADRCEYLRCGDNSTCESIYQSSDKACVCNPGFYYTDSPLTQETVLAGRGAGEDRYNQKGENLVLVGSTERRPRASARVSTAYAGAIINGENCIAKGSEIPGGGCTDVLAHNYDPSALGGEGSCCFTKRDCATQVRVLSGAIMTTAPAGPGGDRMEQPALSQEEQEALDAQLRAIYNLPLEATQGELAQAIADDVIAASAAEAAQAQAAADAQVALDRARDVGAAPGGSTPGAGQVITDLCEYLRCGDNSTCESIYQSGGDKACVCDEGFYYTDPPLNQDIVSAARGAGEDRYNQKGEILVPVGSSERRPIASARVSSGHTGTIIDGGNCIAKGSGFPDSIVPIFTGGCTDNLADNYDPSRMSPGIGGTCCYNRSECVEAAQAAQETAQAAQDVGGISYGSGGSPDRFGPAR